MQPVPTSEAHHQYPGQNGDLNKLYAAAERCIDEANDVVLFTPPNEYDEEDEEASDIYTDDHNLQTRIIAQPSDSEHRATDRGQELLPAGMDSYQKSR